eukprot:GGOE01064910.1.p1 GENE.GGOE01064910.1~~GGOE01064910.1.p1  ORF type:complete len:403 (+),score=105.01 GGOE01064910.1:25-1209(+)
MSGWQCPACTLINDPTTDVCGACGSARPTIAGRVVGDGPQPTETSILLPQRRARGAAPAPEGPHGTVRRILLPLCANSHYIGLALLLLLYTSITAVPAGHVGIVDFFGSVGAQPLRPGLNFVNPLAKVHPVSTRIEMIAATEDVPTQEGLSVHLEAAALYRLDPASAVEMYRTVGMGVLDAIVAANFHSVIREITSGHSAKDLYTARTRTRMMSDLRKNLQALVEDRGIIVEDTPLKKLELPRALQLAIEDKLLAEQASEKMQFVLDKERQEAQRKKIQAGGISEFQRIVSHDISEGMLRWKGIEATELIAETDNPKTVLIGGGPGLSVILPSDTPAPACQSGGDRRDRSGGDDGSGDENGHGSQPAGREVRALVRPDPADRTAQCAAGFRAFC